MKFMETQTTMQGNISIYGVAFIAQIIFLTLRLTHHVTWSWAWVFAPSWLACAYIASVFITTTFVVVCALFVSYINRKTDKNNG